MHEFVHPLTGRYASRTMKELFSPATRIGLWRRLWLELMRAERDLGVGIPAEAIAQLAAHLDPTEAEMQRAAEIERETRHDVMAHIRALAEMAPAAGGWLHLGATSCYVTDNADLIILRRACAAADRARRRGRRGAGRVRRAPRRPGLPRAHPLPARAADDRRQARLPVALRTCWPTSSGSRSRPERLLLRGAKGATGTQASFLQLLGSHDKVRELDRRLAAAFGFAGATRSPARPRRASPSSTCSPACRGSPSRPPSSPPTCAC